MSSGPFLLPSFPSLRPRIEENDNGQDLAFRRLTICRPFLLSRWLRRSNARSCGWSPAPFPSLRSALPSFLSTTPLPPSPPPPSPSLVSEWW